jgi:ADP-dependent NAD(P)H-hydrate dehydratase / NAD(P)H-hydrate epimerase
VRRHRGDGRVNEARVEVVTTAQMRELDRRTIELGTPGLVLMERAGAGVVAHLLAAYRGACRRGVLVVAGRGNNGGDGFVVARLLRAKRFPVTVALLGARDRVGGDARTNLERWLRGRGRLLTIEEGERGLARLDDAIARAGVVLDAILGTGLNAAVSGLAAGAIERMDRARTGQVAAAAERPAKPTPGRSGGAAARARRVSQARARGPVVVAVDLPSGLDGDSGEPWGRAVHADLTITFAAPKVGLLLGAARAFVGRLEVVDIGIAAAAWEALGPALEAVTDDFVRPHVPVRRGSAHKGTNGHVLVVAGSPGKSGAAVLAARGAIRGGAGLTTIACPPEVLAIVAAGLPEAMTEPIAAGAGAEAWRELIAGRTAVVVGPGLGSGASAVALVRSLVEHAAVPVIVDADGLNALAGDLEPLRRAAGPRLLTPHPGEMSRLTGRSVPDVQNDRLGVARAFARDTGAVVVLKGAGTLTVAPDGRAAVNTTGGPLLGSGGSGDVLAGLTGSLLAQGLAPFEAGFVAAFLHGRGADRLAEQLGDAGLLASELADELPRARRAVVAAAAG